MVYCMADIHGEADRFNAMLKKIEFSENDTLYILGDVIDRTPGGVDLLKQIMKTPNMIMILGNHEAMCLATLGPDNQPFGRELWRQNGGDCTYQELLYSCSKEERMQIIDYLLSLPDCLEVEVAGQKYHLVHGFPSLESRDVRLWERPVPGAPSPFKDFIAIVGHTPTYYLEETDEPFKIWHGEGIIDIDCGCGHRSELRRLACLRLDDMQEFYV